QGLHATSQNGLGSKPNHVLEHVNLTNEPDGAQLEVVPTFPSDNYVPTEPEHMVPYQTINETSQPIPHPRINDAWVSDDQLPTESDIEVKNGGWVRGEESSKLDAPDNQESKTETNFFEPNLKEGSNAPPIPSYLGSIAKPDFKAESNFQKELSSETKTKPEGHDSNQAMQPNFESSQPESNIRPEFDK
ncbi:hypothetical protein L0F63_005851, partial [Massospora cicadina]